MFVASASTRVCMALVPCTEYEIVVALDVMDSIMTANSAG
jgi:hypothetical protein